MTIPELKSLRELICKEYIDKFCKKQDLIFDEWIDEVGSWADFNGGLYLFNFSDIVFDLETKQKHGEITRWFSSDDYSRINYKNFLKIENKEEQQNESRND